MGHGLLYCLWACPGKDVSHLLHIQQFKTKSEKGRVEFRSIVVCEHVTVTNYNSNKQTVTDWMLVTAVCVLAGLDVLFLLVVTALPQLRTTAVLKQSVESPSVQTGVCWCRFMKCNVNLLFSLIF